MATARVLCSVTLRVEIYDDLGLSSSDARIARERSFLEAATKLYHNAVDKLVDLAEHPLNPDSPPLFDESPSTATRPFFVLKGVVPMSWSFCFNSFRKADEFECTIPLALLPVPPEAIRVISCYAIVRQVDDDAWASGIDKGGAAPLLGGVGPGDADFAGVCTKSGMSVTDGAIPTVKLPFRDFLGLLAHHKTPPGAVFPQEIPLSKAIAAFLEGTPAEGMTVVWVDPRYPEPTVGKHVPKAKKPKKGKGAPSASKAVHGKQSYLDVIVEECNRVGVVPRVNVTRLELAFAGTMYAGEDQGGEAAATILVGQVVESLEAEHDLIGTKTESIQVNSYDPDTGRLYTARWPPDPKNQKAQVVEPGKPPRLPPLQANVGLPGYEQLDESVLVVDIAPVANPDLLPKVAEAIFLERTRQAVRYTVRTHAPWSDPSQASALGGNLLALRAGKNVRFGYASGDDVIALLPPVVQVLAGNVDAGGVAQLLESAGVESDVAAKIGDFVTRAPRFGLMRVDELRVSGGEKQDGELEIRLVNFTQIVADLISKDSQTAASQFAAFAGRVKDLAIASFSDLQSQMAELYKQAQDMPTDAEREDFEKALDKAYATFLKYR